MFSRVGSVFTPLEIMPRRSAAGLDFRITRAGVNAPLGFESRYSGTGISNGVYFLMENIVSHIWLRVDSHICIRHKLLDDAFDLFCQIVGFF